MAKVEDQATLLWTSFCLYYVAWFCHPILLVINVFFRGGFKLCVLHPWAVDYTCLNLLFEWCLDKISALWVVNFVSRPVILPFAFWIPSVWGWIMNHLCRVTKVKNIELTIGSEHDWISLLLCPRWLSAAEVPVFVCLIAHFHGNQLPAATESEQDFSGTNLQQYSLPILASEFRKG